MAVTCNHLFELLKSSVNIMSWNCGKCSTGREAPQWGIYQCKYCQFKICQSCYNAMYRST